jgi:hypothetical protein
LRLRFNDFAIAVRALAIVVFMFSTAPVAAHMIGRAAYLSGVPLWEGTLSDEMHGCYDAETYISCLARGDEFQPRSRLRQLWINMTSVSFTINQKLRCQLNYALIEIVIISDS